jgi:hypothetical protein
MKNNKIIYHFNLMQVHIKKFNELHNLKVKLKTNFLKKYQNIVSNKILSKTKNLNIRLEFLAEQVILIDNLTNKEICLFTLYLNPEEQKGSISFTINSFKSSISLKSLNFIILQKIFYIFNQKTINIINNRITNEYVKYLKKNKVYNNKTKIARKNAAKNQNIVSKIGFNKFIKGYTFKTKPEYINGLNLTKQTHLLLNPQLISPQTKSLKLLNSSKGEIELKDIKNNIINIKNETNLLEFYKLVIFPNLLKFDIINE